MDIHMPVRNGVEVTRQVRTLPRHPAVIVLTTVNAA